MFPYPASWHAPPFPPMACECLAAIDAALLGSGVKAKASHSSDKWARQDIFMETLAKPPEKPCNAHHFPFSLPQCWKHAKIHGIFSSYSSCLSTRSDQILTCLCQTQGTYPRYTTHTISGLLITCLHHSKLLHNLWKDSFTQCEEWFSGRQITLMLSGRDSISFIMMGVMSQPSAVILNALFGCSNTVKSTSEYEIEEGLKGDDPATSISYNLYHGCLNMKTGSILPIVYTRSCAMENRQQTFLTSQSIPNKNIWDQGVGKTVILPISPL